VVDPLFDATPHAGPPSLEGGPARADGALLSDNARLEAGQPRSGCALSAAFLLFALLAAAVVAYVVTRG
jgi:hypothetical protein